MQLQLSREEQLELENISFKMNGLRFQYKNLQERNNQIIETFCKNNSQVPEHIKEINTEKGYILFKTKAELKKEEKAAK